MRRKY